ncbi:SDR family NAD(P)-dependent oxidoreductase [Paenibacillus sp. 19GGS1-52]|uniref:SDR family NAD(P)-dependent oxidoreductase n=1 Tax=Paenibacillus sp. 19GGS1-52 TaxID=2758563 RepID=UPI001EFA72C1|nr:SDR family NAD(P)-dependent oxidoreductase [Paenibacillus sp. 19GGS1-52]ULO10205.1 SDR family NAD(P)-dependent oxidoreductase [Paenibacillus sp. 19GGS1-52]
MENERTSSEKTFIITGGNTGLGYACAKNIAKDNKKNQIVIACRNATKAQEAVNSLIKETGNDNIISLELDLSSIESVRDFVIRFSDAKLPPLYAIVCNAGIQVVNKAQYTKDGFELTFGVNHPGHFLLVNLLLENISDAGRIVFVSSGTHDPLQKTGMPEPKYENARLLAYPKEMGSKEETGSIGRRSYTTSKLCNIYCTYELAERITQQTNKNITVNAFDPGLMPGTGLARSYSPFLRFVSKYILSLLILVHPKVHTIGKSGKALASLVTKPELDTTTGKYFEGTKEIKSSVLSYNKENRKDLWRTSVELTALNQ